MKNSTNFFIPLTIIIGVICIIAFVIKEEIKKK